MDTIQVPAGSVVIGVDGSAGSDRAVLWGIEQARIERRPVVLVHAVSSTVATTWMGSPGYNPATVVEALEESGRALLQTAAQMVHEQDSSLEVYRVLEHRDPRDALLRLSHRAAVLVMGSRGHGRMASLLLGSVSLAVSQHAACPVVVMRDGHHHSGPHGGIVVGADGSERSDSAVGFAFRQASMRSLPLTVVHAFWSEQDEGYPSTAPTYDAADLEDMRLLLAESIAGAESDYPEVKVTLHVERGIPDNVLVRSCEDADLLVVGTHPTNAVYALLAGEVSRSLLARAECPVAVVPDSV